MLCSFLGRGKTSRLGIVKQGGFRDLRRISVFYCKSDVFMLESFPLGGGWLGGSFEMNVNLTRKVAMNKVSDFDKCFYG